MADVMAQIDWSATPVGPRSQWPPLLDSLVRVLLASEFAMWIGWGPDLAFFYNDAYRRATLGRKHPWALGRPVREVWAEALDDLEPRVREVLEGASTWDEALMLFLERNGFPEETYHTFSYSPIADADGTVHGLLCVVNEETDRVIGGRRMTTLRQLASELSGVRQEEEVYAAVDAQLRENPYDLPYTLTYIFEGSDRARLVCATGATPGSPIAPHVIERGDGTWPLNDIDEDGQTLVVDGIRARFGDVPCGAWDVPADTAIVVPLAQQRQMFPAGFLVAGRNPHRPLDAGFVGFVELVAGQVAAGIAGARAYEAERQRAEALAELDRVKTEFFSNVSHELRTPLTLIVGPAEDALDDIAEPLPPTQEGRLEVIQRNARRLRRLVDDMLDFARIEGGRLRAETVPTDLAELTRDVTFSFAPAIERAGLELDVHCGPLPRPVFVDQEMWEKILLNLLSNALKFTLAGSIAVSLADDGDAAVLAVRDTGVGIPADQLGRLFERFYRAPRRDARSHEGSGIGLALVHELVQLHGGTVVVESEEGAGSTFTVRIPYGEGPTGTGPRAAESALQSYLDEALQWFPEPERRTTLPQLRAGRTAHATVLVVDDNPDMRRYVSRILEPYWSVTTATDGAAALEVVRDARPDLVLADVMMPRVDGLHLLEALRSDARTATVPVIFLSARAGEEEAIEGLAAGADDYLVKPFSPVELMARVRSNLELAAMRSQEAAWRRAMVESLEEGLVVLDASFHVIEVNPAFERIVGFPPAGTPYWPPFPWAPDPDTDPDEHRRFEALVERVRTEGHFRGVVMIRHRQGHAVYVDATVQSLLIEGERRYVASLRDVTAERLSAARASALARLGTRLTTASQADDVVTVGLDELRRVFGAARTGIALPGEDHGEVVNGALGNGALGNGALDGGLSNDALGNGQRGDGALDGPLGDAVAAALRGGTVVEATAGSRTTGMAAPLDPAGGTGAVWLDFGAPRQVGADDRALFAVLCGYFGQALRRAQLFDANQAVATAMQRSILGPTDVPSGVAVRYAPAVQPLEVGGDWYDAVELPGNRLGLVVGDCVGRGLPAATVMGQLRSACRALLLQAQRPADVVAALDAFADRLPGAPCTTVFCGIVDRIERTLRYCSAGHVPGSVLRPDGTVEWLHQPGSLPLAVAPERPRAEATVALSPGTWLVLCTDGLVERRGELLDDGLARLTGALRDGRDLTPHALADHLMRQALPAGGQEDDVAIVIYREPDMADAAALSLSVPADPTYLSSFRHKLAGWLAGTTATDHDQAEIVIAVAEAVANAMEHAFGFDGQHRVRVSASVTGRGVEVRVEDSGQWRPPATDREDRGRGVQIMRGLMDRVTLTSGSEGTTVLLVRKVGG